MGKRLPGNKIAFDYFDCSDGVMSFVIPFITEDSVICKELFKSISDHEKKKDVLSKKEMKYYENHEIWKDVEFEKESHDLYKEHKELFIKNVLKESEKKFYQNEVHFWDNAEPYYKCPNAGNDINCKYKGRNLCRCFSLSRKFHDDKAENHERFEIFLGSYPVKYTVFNNKSSIEFTIDCLLLLTNEEDDKSGYLVLNIPITSIDENLGIAQKGIKLNSLIFIKHLFYKSRLKMVHVGEYESVSLQEWAIAYLDRLFAALKLKFENVVNDYVKGAAFRYSIIELNDVKDDKDKLISVDNLATFKERYIRQLYGLLVSDEGWQFVPDIDLNRVDSWQTRSYCCSFFLEHSALVINQYDSNYNNNCDFAYSWFKNYTYGEYENKEHLNHYREYVKIRSCVAGVSSLVFFAFIKAICKEMLLTRVEKETISSDSTIAVKYNRLYNVLQTHSMSFGEIRNVEECIYKQFGIPDQLQVLSQRYEREANNMQNSHVTDLTLVTMLISMISILIAIISVVLTLTNYDSGDWFKCHSIFWRVVGLICIALAVVFVFWIVLISLFPSVKKQFNNIRFPLFRKIKGLFSNDKTN